MIDIADADVDWNEELANDPRLILYVDALPSRNELEFDGSKDLGLWYGEHESGYVDFYSWSGGQGEGYGGRHVDIETVDGREVTLKGPYSSRAGVMNKAGFGPCLDVTYREPGQDIGGRAGAVTLETAEDAVARYLDGVELVREDQFAADEPYWIPRRTGNHDSADTPG